MITINIIDKSDYEELYPEIKTGSAYLDVLLTQIQICYSNLDGILFFFHGDYEEITKDMENLFWKAQFDQALLLKDTIDNKEKEDAYKKIIVLSSKIPNDSKLKLEARIPFKMDDDFIESLASTFCLLGILHCQIEKIMEGGIDKVNEAKDYLMENYVYITHLAIMTGIKRGSFMQKAQTFFKEPELSIQQKGAMARKEKYRKKKEEAWKIFNKGGFYSYAECARQIHEILGVKDPNTVARWLSEMRKEN